MEKTDGMKTNELLEKQEGKNISGP